MPRDIVNRMAARMELRLAANDHKGGWRYDKSTELATEAARKLGLMLDLLKRRPVPSQDVADLAADVANYTMMAADVAGGLPAPMRRGCSRETLEKLLGPQKDLLDAKYRDITRIGRDGKRYSLKDAEWLAASDSMSKPEWNDFLLRSPSGNYFMFEPRSVSGANHVTPLTEEEAVRFFGRYGDASLIEQIFGVTVEDA